MGSGAPAPEGRASKELAPKILREFVNPASESGLISDW